MEPWIDVNDLSNARRASSPTNSTSATRSVQNRPVEASDVGVSRSISRKRHSFLRRSISVVSPCQQVDSGNVMEASLASENPLRLPSRSASGSKFPRPSQTSRRRKNSEPLHALRSSIFGSKKHRQQNSSTRSSFSSHPSSASWAIPSLHHNDNDIYPCNGEFSSEAEYYRHLKKASISPPFNFQHVTHTVRKQLPSLENVDEKDLSARFWAVSAYQVPRRHLNGIKADDIPQVWVPSNPSPSSISRPKTSTAKPPAASEPSFDPEVLIVPKHLDKSPDLDQKEPLLPGLDRRVPAALHNAGQPSNKDQDTAANAWDALSTDRSLSHISERTLDTALGDSERSSWLWLSTQFPKPPTHKRNISTVTGSEPLTRIEDERHQTSPMLGGNQTKASMIETEVARLTQSQHKTSPQDFTATKTGAVELDSDGEKAGISRGSVVNRTDGEAAELAGDFQWAANILAVRDRFHRNSGGSFPSSPLTGTSSVETPERRLSPHRTAALSPSRHTRPNRGHHTRPSVGHHGFVQARQVAIEQLGMSRSSPLVTPEAPVVERNGDKPRSISSAASIIEHLSSSVNPPSMTTTSFSECTSDFDSVHTDDSRLRNKSSHSSNESFYPIARSASGTSELLASSVNATSLEKHLSPKALPVSVGQPQAVEVRHLSPDKGTIAASRPYSGANGDVTIIRRPETPGERAVLQAAGVAAKKLQRRPTTPNSPVQGVAGGGRASYRAGIGSPPALPFHKAGRSWI